MVDVIKLLFKNKGLRAIARSSIITVIFFVAVNDFVKIITGNTGLIILSLVTFYILFHIIAFGGLRKNGKKNRN